MKTCSDRKKEEPSGSQRPESRLRPVQMTVRGGT